MEKITYREAIRRAIDEEMERDETVFIMGEEVALYNGAYKVTQGLHDKYGDKRVIDTPITEEGFAGIGIGAAMAGLRPIVEFMTFNFAIQALDQIINNAAKMRYMSGGQFKVPIVFRGPNGPAEFLGAQHSQGLQSILAHIPGLKVVAPGTPADALGLLKSAVRDDNPVIILESELMYAWEGEVPRGEHIVPIGKADIKREGRDITLVSFSKPLRLVEEAAETLAQEGVEAEVIDMRSLRPLDEETLIESVKKTNRCVIVDEAWPLAGMASHLGFVVSSKAFDFLDAPVEIVTMEDVPMPYNHRLELAIQPDKEKIIKAANKTLYR